MAKKKLSRREEYELYKDSEYQRPQGSARKRKAKLTEMIPVRFSRDVLDEVRRLADADDRSTSAWIRRAVERELERQRSAS